MEAQGEFQSVDFLARAYFGPKTKAAIEDLSAVEGSWWAKPKDKQNALVDAMIDGNTSVETGRSTMIGQDKGKVLVLGTIAVGRANGSIQSTLN